MNRVKKIAFLSFLVFICTSFFASQVRASVDVTTQLERLGIPCANKAAYARNIWDLIEYHGSVYVGCGDIIANAGPIDVWAYSPASGWRNEFTVDDEKVNSFRILNDNLVFPGADAREGWEFGNWYDRDVAGNWAKHRNIPGGVHVFDVFDYGGKRFVAFGASSASKPSIGVSTNNGETWNLLMGPPGAVGTVTPCSSSGTYHATWTNSFFTIAGNLYADTIGYYDFECVDGKAQYTQGYQWLRWDGTNFQKETVLPFPGSQLKTVGMIRSQEYGDKTLYLGRRNYTSTLYQIDSAMNPQAIALPNCSMPLDIILKGAVISVLCNHPDGQNWTISVVQSSDTLTWNQVMHFTADTYAQSFEQLNGDFYFGLGAGSAPFPADTGEILRVKNNLTASPTPAMCQGDINQDRQVNLSDYSLLVQSFLKSPLTNTQADLNQDGAVNLLDYSLLVKNFLRTCL